MNHISASHKVQPNPRHSAALDYAARGWVVFPARTDKKKSFKAARFSGGERWGATTDPKIISQDWRSWPDANVGIATGPGSGIFVIEADTLEGHGVDGLASIAALESKHRALPDTLTAMSPSGSIHRYFRHPGFKVKNSASEIALGVDVRGNGGMVIGPPSIKPGVGTYVWLNNSPVVDAPQWLLDLIAKTDKAAEKPATISERAVAMIRKPASISNNKHVEAALNRECDAVASAAIGSRNAQLNASAFSLGTLVGAGELTEDAVETTLINAAAACGLIQDDGKAACLATIKSGLTSGTKQPRSIPEPKRRSRHSDIAWLHELTRDHNA